ncbi:hypothetical protein CASFOL_012370 [Castilleja foliolosa]|uniref:MATH domain-containing protein n=1 Tax=Castilleja foliolosa TaxID=1961234 RepID=A0ABD3DGU8_9LAMI
MSSLSPVDEVEMETREASPAHYLIKIDSFSMFGKNGIDKFETKEFESGEYKWRLVIYPNGRGKDGEGYVSVYLAMTNYTNALTSNLQVYATFSIFLFNQFSGKFCYSLGRARQFHALKQEWGFIKFISKKDFNDPLNGYLVDDKCGFGAEVFVHETKAVIECLSLKNTVDNNRYKREFKILNFSTLKEKWNSEEFTVGGYKWIIDAYPNGLGQETGQSLSIFLRPVVSNNRASSERVRPCYTIRIKNYQGTISDHWFSASESVGWGWPSFIKLSTLNDPNKGFIVNDCCLIEVELAVQAISS